MKKLLMIAALALATAAHGAPLSVFERLDREPLRSASNSNGKPYKAAYALCSSSSYTPATMYRIVRTSVRGTGSLSYTDHIYLHLYNGDLVPVSRSDCKFFYIN